MQAAHDPCMHASRAGICLFKWQGATSRLGLLRTPRGNRATWSGKSNPHDRNELNGEIGVAAYGPLSPDTSYRHSTLSFADRAPVIGVPKAHYTVPSLALAIGQWRRASRDRGCKPHTKCTKFVILSATGELMSLSGSVESDMPVISYAWVRPTHTYRTQRDMPRLHASQQSHRAHGRAGSAKN